MAIPRRYRQQAKDLAVVRYGPELGALTALLKQAQQTRSEQIGSARTANAAIQSSLDLARPEARNVYTAAQRTANAQNAITAPSLAALPAGNPYSAAAAIEQSGLKGRLAESKAATLSELSQRRVDAAAGYAGTRRQAQRDYGKTLGQLGDRGRGITQEMGAYIGSTIADLTGADAKARAEAKRIAAQLNASRGNAWISAGVDPATGKPIPGGRLDPNAPQNQPESAKPTKPSKPTGADRTAAADYSKAQKWIERLDNPTLHKQVGSNRKAARHAIAENLLLGNPKAGIPAVPRPVLSAALDMYFDGEIGNNTVRLLHQLGYKVGRLPGTVTRRQRARSAPTGNLGRGRSRSTPYHGPGYRP
jgi:hypothetical protein